MFIKLIFSVINYYARFFFKCTCVYHTPGVLIVYGAGIDFKETQVQEVAYCLVKMIIN